MALLAALFTARAAATSKLGPAMQVFFNFGLISTFFFEEPLRCDRPYAKAPKQAP